MTLKQAIDYLTERESQELYPHKDVDDTHVVIIRYPNYPLMQLCSVQEQVLSKLATISDDYINEHATDPDWYITCNAYIGKNSAGFDKNAHLVME